MMSNLFESEDYKHYLRDALSTRGAERGARTRLAAALGCQTTFISQVLNGKTHFSAEHALKVSRFLAHTPEETDHFLALVAHAKAGTRDLQGHYLAKIRESRERRERIGSRIRSREELSAEQQSTYYSAWYYSAIHVLLLVPRFGTKEAIAAQLGLPIARVAECLEFLASVGLAERDGARYRNGATRLHLGQGSPMLARHHANWRTRALVALDRADPANLHYSSVMSISADAFARIKAILLASIEQTEPVIREAKDDGLYCFTLDLFGV